MDTVRRIGLVVLGLLALGDLATPLVTDGAHPPMGVAIFAAVLGLASVGCLPGAWHGDRRALLGLMGTRLLSAVLAAPAFFIDDAPGEVVGIVAATLGLTVVGVVAALLGTRRAVTT